MTSAIDQLLKLKGVSYEWIDPAVHKDDSGTVTGFIAQDVEKVFPSWVDQKGYVAPDGQAFRTLELRQIEALEVESIRTLKTQNDMLTERLAALESGRQLRVSGINLNGVGFAIGGIALAGGLVFSRRKRSERQA